MNTELVKINKISYKLQCFKYNQLIIGNRAINLVAVMFFVYGYIKLSLVVGILSEPISVECAGNLWSTGVKSAQWTDVLN